MPALPPPPPPPPPSTTIFVTESRDYSGQTITGIDSITFTTTAFARATFSSLQFGSGRISDTVHITGDEHRNFVEVHLSSAGSFSAAGWTFSNWVPFTPLQNDQVILRGTSGDDTLTGSSQADSMSGDEGNDALHGGEHNDILVGGLGVDTLTGGEGDDDYRLEDVTRIGEFPLKFAYDTVVEEALGGIDIVLVRRVGIVGGYTLPANVENGFVNAPGTFTLFGNEHHNRLTGNDDANVFRGFAGTDTLLGRGADDTLEGGDGDDVLDGGNGIDTASYASAGAAVSVSLAIAGPQNTGGAGIDTLSLIENLIGSAFNDTLTGDGAVNTLSGENGADNLNGNGGNDTLNGGFGNDTLNGGLGNDRLNGAAGGDRMAGQVGNDVYSVDSNLDVVIEGAGGGIDTVITAVTRTLGAEQEHLILAGAAAINGGGNALANRLAGNGAANSLIGHAGADTMAGSAGNDIYVVADVGDVIAELLNEGTDTVRTSVNHTLSANVEQLFLAAGAGNIAGGGNALANRIDGNEGHNLLVGKAGNDSLTGGAGQDHFLFNATLDTETNVDAVTDYSVASDTIRLENAVFTGLAAGVFLTAAQFHIGAAAANANQRVIYNAANGDLFFDADGLGGAAQTRFANLDAGLAPTHMDFFVV